MNVVYLVALLASAACSAILTVAVRRAALRLGVVDQPGVAPDRKVHRSPVPLLGGSAPMLAFFLILALVGAWRPGALSGFSARVYLGLGMATFLLVLGGSLDDRFRLSPGRQIVWPILATLVVLAAGVGVHYITNPFGGLLRLDRQVITLFAIGGVPIVFTVWANVFSFSWLLGMSYTTKFLDGLDGLVAGVTAIGGFIIFMLSLRPEVNQPTTALIALLLSGAMLGFLPFNFHPARIFLGEGGSLWAGFMLGVLAIISGGKIASALLLLGIPILDVAWVIVRRIRERRSPFRTSDRKHLHFRLLDVGFSHRGAVLFLYGLTALFGTMTLLFRGWHKLVALLALAVVMAGLGAILVRRSR